MKIGIISSPRIQVPPIGYGGAERVVYFLIKGLQELGHEVVLFGPRDSQVDCEIVSVADTINYAMTDEEELKCNLQTEQILREIADKVRENLFRLDIINSHEEMFDLSPFRDFPHLQTLHNSFSNGFNTDKFYERKDYLFYNSISHNQRNAFPMLNYVGTIYNGLDPDEFPVNITPQNYFAFIGRFSPVKSPNLAIWWAIKNNVKIKLAGNYNFRDSDYFHRELEGLFEMENVEFIGEADMEMKIDLLSNAIGNLHFIKFREPFGLSVLEAGYMGTPTLAIKRGSMQELIEDGKTGILVEDFDEGIFKLEDIKGIDRATVAKSFRKRFNYKIMAKQYELAYTNLIDIFAQTTVNDISVKEREGLVISSSASIDQQYQELTA